METLADPVFVIVFGLHGFLRRQSTMTYDDVVAQCRWAFADGAPAWPAGLIRFLDQPPDLQRVFAWVVQCTRRLLSVLGESTPDIDEQLKLLESYIRESVDVVTIRETMEQLWVQRSPSATAKTAVVQLFGALMRYREAYIYRHLGCTVSITMLVGAAQNREQAFEEVLKDFGAFVAEEGRRTG
jgi:hypothetical protein